MKKLFELDWLMDLDKRQLQTVLLEYRSFVKRFISWVALVIVDCEDDDVKKYLIQNIYEECGLNDTKKTHVFLLDEVIKQTGYKGEIDCYKPFSTTIKIENWFYNVYQGSDLYKKLCVLGPATEDISHLFIGPLRDAIEMIFRDKNIDYSYFDIHLSEIERNHAKNIEMAIKKMEKHDKSLRKKYIKYKQKGINKHIEFWKHLEENIKKTV